ncbi:MAG: glycosyl transferase, partial [Bacteroidia bacterium]|nr:glycosyl transferase [Bacteroidia bacterium]
NKPIESIWGNTHPLFGMYPYFPKKTENLSNMHQVDLKCRPCSKLGSSSCPRGHFNCMKLHNVEEIVKNCNSIEGIQ